jgi:probable HAF family extracellular repeat protein
MFLELEPITLRGALRLGVLAAAVIVPAPAYAGLSYRVDWIDAPDGVMAVDAADISDRGQVAGSCISPAGLDGYTWSKRNGFVTLGRIAGADWMTANALNDRGAVVGNAEWSDGTKRPVIWSEPGQPRDLGVFGLFSFESPDSSWQVSSAMATDINNRGHVVGSTSAPQYAEVAYLWKPQHGMRLLGTLGGATSTAWAVNVWDEVVGTSELADGTRHAFLWSKGKMVDLGALSGSSSEGYAINDLGEVTGIYQTPAGETRVFRWTRARGMHDVGATYAGVVDGITSLSTGINLIGQIVGGIQPPGQQIRAAVRQPFSGAWQELMPGSPFTSFALDSNNLGVIVGRVHASNEEEPSRAAVWTPVYTFP